MSRIRYGFERLASGFCPPNIKKWWCGWARVREWGVLRTVNVNWNDDGWNANANALDDNRWNDDNQVLSRNSEKFSRLRGSFAFKAFFPAVEHLTDFLDAREEGRILRSGKEFVFPSDLQKKFRHINSCDGFCEEGEFALRREIA